MNVNKKESLRNRLLIQHTAIILIIIAALIIANAVFLGKMLNDEGMRDMSVYAHQYMSNLEQFINSQVEMVTNFSKNSLLINAMTDPKGRNTYLPKLIDNLILDKNINSVNVVDFTGTSIYSTTSHPVDYSRTRHLRMAIAGGSAAYFISDDKYLVCAAPIIYYKTPQGAIIVEFRLSNIFSNLISKEDNFLYRLFAKEQLLAEINFKNTGSYTSIHKDAGIEHPLLKKLSIKIDIGVLKSEKNKILIQSMLKGAIIGLLFMLIAEILTYKIGGNIAEPILQLCSRVEAASQGSKITCSPVGTNDELEVLAEVFDKRTQELENAKTALEKSVDTLMQEINERMDADALNAKLSAVVEQSPSVVVITDIEGNIEYVNHRFTEITGYTSAEVMGKNPRILKSDHTNPDEHKKLWSAITAGRQWNGEICNKKKSGEIYWEYATVFPLKNGAGETVNYLKVAEDLTARRSLEEQLRQSQKMEAIGQLTGGIAHDFNNILFAITNYVYLLQKKIGGDATLKKYVDNIQFAAEKASDLTRSLLAFSRKQIIQPKPVNLNEIISNMEKLMRRLIPAECELRTKLTEKAFTIMADPVQIEQILVNLVTNARDAMPEGGLLVIQTEVVEIDKTYLSPQEFIDAGVYAILTVSDTGTGITEGVRKKMFEPFFTTKELGKGTGLGLSTVYGIVTQHNGRIHVYSEPGGGAAFKIFLPVIASLDKAHVTEEHAKTMGGSETLLVMEDDPMIMSVMREIFQGAGYRIIEAVDGVEGIEKFNEHKDSSKTPIDMLILDVMMPRKNGKQVYDEIRAENPNMKALFLSGYTSDVLSSKGIVAEGVNLLMKPVSAVELLKKIREVLDN